MSQIKNGVEPVLTCAWTSQSWKMHSYNATLSICWTLTAETVQFFLRWNQMWLKLIYLWFSQMCVSEERSGQNTSRSISTEIIYRTSFAKVQDDYRDRSAETKLPHFLLEPAAFCIFSDWVGREKRAQLVFITLLQLIFKLWWLCSGFTALVAAVFHRNQQRQQKPQLKEIIICILKIILD